MASFCVADLSAAGEVRLKEQYEYRLLEKVGGAVELISLFSSHLWRSPEEFETSLPNSGLAMRWRACSTASGLATLREADHLLSFSILLSGRDAESDLATLKPLQARLLRELHDTGHEPAFDLMHLTERPLVASVHFGTPAGEAERRIFALADRCFAASYFRKLGLA